jgi:hypothetical protein
VRDWSELLQPCKLLSSSDNIFCLSPFGNLQSNNGDNDCCDPPRKVTWQNELARSGWVCSSFFRVKNAMFNVAIDSVVILTKHGSATRR